MNFPKDEGLLEYATPRQAEILEAYWKHGTDRKAAKALGCNKSLPHNVRKAVQKKAAMHGYAPDHDLVHIVPPPFELIGASTLYDEAGNKKLQWVKTRRSHENSLELLKEFAESLGEECAGKSPKIPTPKTDCSHLLTVYPLGDPHIGMYAWAAETGENFDLEIAERDLTIAATRLVAVAPDSDVAIVLNLGDFFHSDNNKNQTARSGHDLDVDGRWGKVMQVGARIMVKVIELAAHKHRQVVVRNVVGNHDDQSSYALALILDAYFRNNARVSVDLSPAPFWYYRFGKVLIGTTHGDMCKLAQLPEIMACDAPEDWGKTQHRYWYTGHIHHESVKDYPGCRVESFRTLAAKDAWHTAAGYRSARDMHCIVLHKEFGEVDRHRCNIAMVRAI